jgi:hypothetical protein
VIGRILEAAALAVAVVLLLALFGAACLVKAVQSCLRGRP